MELGRLPTSVKDVLVRLRLEHESEERQRRGIEHAAEDGLLGHAERAILVEAGWL